MCGIAGQYEFSAGHPSLHGLEKATLRQQQRGPDGDGIYRLDNLAFGHRRLRIFDLTDKAAQPMVDHSLGLALVFNGAIYNFPALRRELLAKGYRFTSGSDTEVLLKAWHAWGDACISRLQGMFAFAVWERESGRLTLVRDRMGIKPLYYAHTPQGFKFASTLPAMLEFDGIDTSIDKTALHYYLTFHAIPEPLTIFSGIQKLSPASFMTVQETGQTEMKSYWQLRFNDAATATHTADEWLRQLQETLSTATKRQMAADVPVGILLSGGLDSSLLVALAAQQRDAANIETFSIGFDSIGNEPGDEFFYSDKVARHFGTKHHKIRISNDVLLENLDSCIAEMSEPMLSHDNIGFFMLSKEVAKHVKVALSGQGADELFAGYHWFQQLPEQPLSASKQAIFLRQHIADRSFADYQKLVTPAYQVGDHAKAYLWKHCLKNKSPLLADQLLAYESGFALSSGPLARVDNMTMAASLEARVPFLDEMVVELATSMPLGWKLNDGGKFLLKQLGRTLLPAEIVDRPKGYFPVPALKHIEGDLLARLREVLSPRAVRQRGLFEPAVIERLLADPSGHMTPNGASQLWQIGLLELWFQQQGVSS